MRMAVVASALIALIAGVPALAQPRAAANSAPVQVMVLGSWHFDNPGLDLNNIRAEDVLTPHRQRELDAVARAIAAFRPTRVMVERVGRGADLSDPNYAAFTPDTLRTVRNERAQLGYRIARLAGLTRVDAIDEQPGEGEPDYFPFDAVAAYAKASGMDEQLQAMMGTIAAEAKSFEARQRTTTIAQLLLSANDPAGVQSSIAGYYQLLRIGDAERQPGAVLNAMWYMRNAKIFGKLMLLARPGDRVLVIYGAGHNYWLRHFAAETDGFRNVDPAPYLRRAAAPEARP